ncbi:histidine--tRNA ligase [Aureibaculum sp. 2210JD6-5]|uniref:histidine--tRNA ligase n=1 Tax=Aureibaculum sp. 2210JD6-5 TaxID=3103957 RepID=UPI002AAD9417|nr:histidine--tRNA ligase [Aureibaculum sp. 2210JD6-5]MDY7393636.1 histidine--tRNA ligase [Aureibaculum sp. 2210JD6-5]
MAQKPSIPKGTRDFSPTEVAQRNYIFNVIKEAFENYGFQPIETPSFENSSTLMGKYGEEGDRLIFKILNSGDYLAKADETALTTKDSNALTSSISEKALRYDLTVPFARYVVQHQNEIEFPFKRYQMQPVWRADRPQKGRFREFYQCDADVVGSTSLWQEVEFVQLYDDIFTKLGLKDTTIKINNRKILSGIAEVIGASDKLIDFTVALDKLDKIGKDGVVKEMLGKGITEEAIKKVEPLLELEGDNDSMVKELKVILEDSDQGLQGVSELEFVIDNVKKLGLSTSSLKLDVTLARGLNYYTGAIFEVQADEVKMGSIGGGGRYDDLTGIFGLKDVSGIGISFGLDRIYLVLEELGLFQKVELPKPKVLFINFGEKEAFYCLEAIKKLRENGVKSELYPDDTKLKKQMNYANRRDIDYVVLAGESELNERTFTLKNMKTGEQISCNFETLLKTVNNS